MDEAQLSNEILQEANKGRYERLQVSVTNWLTTNSDDQEVLRIKERLDSLSAKVNDPQAFEVELHHLWGSFTEIKNRSASADRAA